MEPKLYAALLEHLIHMSGNKLLITLLELAKSNPETLMRLNNLRTVDLEVLAMFDGKTHTSFIQCIKHYRSYTGEGLKESKATVEEILGVKSIDLNNPEGDTSWRS